jgi:hypothetical protein
MSSIRFLVVGGLAVALPACGPSIWHARADPALEDIARQPPAPGPAIPVARPLNITIESPSLGGVVLSDGKVNGEYQFSASLHELPGGADEASLEAECSKLNQEKKQVFAGILVEDFGKALAKSLQRRLGTRLPGSTVVVGRGGALHVRSTGTFLQIGDNYTVRFNFEAFPAGSALPMGVQAEGSHEGVASSNLYWAIPVGIVTFPIGLAIINGVFVSMVNSRRSETFAVAIEDASAKLADAIFRWASQTPEPQGMPPAVYPQPQASYPQSGNPPPSYPAPQPSYPAPQSSYPAPQPGYPAPQPGYPAPQPSYPAPQPSYPAPQPGYPAPQPGYPPSQPSYPPPQPPVLPPENRGPTGF